MPYEGIPIRGNEHCASAWPQNAECFAKNTIHVRDVLGDLSACNDIEPSVRLTYLGRISDNVCKPFRGVASLAQRNEVTRNVDACDSAVTTNNVSDTFTKEPGTATDIQHALAAAQSELLDRFRSLRDDISC